MPSRLLVDCVPIDPAPCDTRPEPMFSGLTTRLIDNFLIPGNVTEYVLTAAQKLLLAPESGNILKFAILGWDLEDAAGVAYAGIEATGNYWSDAYGFRYLAVVPIPEPATLALLVIGLLSVPRGTVCRALANSGG